MRPGASRILVGVGEEELGIRVLARGAGHGLRSTTGIQEHPCPLQQGCSSPAILGDAAQTQGVEGAVSASGSSASSRAVLSSLRMSTPRPISQIEEAPIPPIPLYHPCGTASPWKPTALRLPPGNQRGDTFRNIIFTDDKWWRLGADKGDERSAGHRLFSQWPVFLLLFLLRARAAGGSARVLSAGRASGRCRTGRCGGQSSLRRLGLGVIKRKILHLV